MLFYALAPFYRAARYHTLGLSAGVLALNLAAIALAIWIAARHGGGSAAALLAAVCAWYFLQVTPLLASAWNAHATIAASFALMSAGAAVAAGAVRLIPLVAVLASFAVQTHIALLPLAVTVTAVDLTALLGQARSGGRTPRRRAWPSLLWAAPLVLIVWLPPIAEQMTAPEENVGNITRMLAFARTFAAKPSTGAAASDASPVDHWAAMVTGAAFGALRAPDGQLIVDQSRWWVGVAAVAQIAAAAFCGWHAARTRQTYLAALIAIAVLASVGGLAAVSRIPDGIHDHEVFWLSVPGALMIAGGLAVAFQRILRRDLPDRVGTMALPILVVLGIAIAAVGELRQRERRAARATGYDITIRNAATSIEQAVARTGFTRPLATIDGRVWETAAGTVLELRKRGLRVAVEDASMFSGAPARSGSEDVEIAFCGGPCHDRNVTRPANVTLFANDVMAVDAIPLGK
jgi:hypothetical protein